MNEPIVHKFFPVEVVEYQQQSTSYDDVIELLRNETFKEHAAFSSVRDLHDDEKFDSTFEFINSCLEDYRQRFNYDCDKLEVSSSWCNYSEPNSGMGHQFHRHSMSFVSGVYYFTGGAAIGFEDPMTPRVMNQIEVLRLGHAPFHYITPTPGKLIIFPSWLYHWTKPHTDDFERWNISFNALPSGKINFNMATDSTAIIKLEKS